MLQFFKKLFNSAPKADFKELIQKGAIIVDVRTKSEYQQGHVKGALNIPLNNLSNHYSSLKKDVPIITCCASGVRSAQARNILKANGFPEVYNGGGWTTVLSKIS